ncbi:MAG: hypothetical protein EXR77_15895 [Myxococcales bacterium]|nr:hypothetical protein [Myxococcales bacterium]
MSIAAPQLTVAATALAEPQPPPAQKQTPGCVSAGVTIASAAKNCVYGLPALADELVLIPKSCRHDLGGKAVDRHSVEVRALSTGARIAQASLPPTPATAAQPPSPGEVLVGTPALLVLANGIASIDARKGDADMAFEAQGQLLGAARLGDLLAIAEALPAPKGAKPTIEWTILDLEAGGIVGQAVVAGNSISAIALRRSATGVVAAVHLGHDATAVQLVADVLDGANKSALKNGNLVPRRVVLSPALSPVDAGGCPVFGGAVAVVVGRPAAVIQGNHTELASTSTGIPWHSSPQSCVVIRQNSVGLRHVAWLRLPSGEVQLHAVQCSTTKADKSAY